MYIYDPQFRVRYVRKVIIIAKMDKYVFKVVGFRTKNSENPITFRLYAWVNLSPSTP